MILEKAQALGPQFCKESFPGHPAIICAHPDGHNRAGNIHVHIIISSLQTRTIERQPYMQDTPETGTIEVFLNPAVEPPNRPRAARLEQLVYKVDEIAQLLAISPRAAYNLCNTTRGFRVVRIGTSIGANKQRVDAWFAAL